MESLTGRQIARTYTKSLDNRAGLTPFLNNSSPWSNYGPSNFDQTHVFTLTYNLGHPFGAGAPYLKSGHRRQDSWSMETDGILR
jgi:hypothetical protein